MSDKQPLSEQQEGAQCDGGSPTSLDHRTLRLYVTGLTPRSIKAVGNIRRICDKYLSGRHTLEIIDIYQRPIIARSDQIVACPTLVIESPFSIRRLVGDLSCQNRVLVALGIQDATGRNTNQTPHL